jgi:hypothetical protein
MARRAMNLHPAMSARSTLAELKNAKIWLIWKAVIRPGKTKPDKVPFYTNGRPRGTTDTPDDLAQLETYDAVVAAAASRGAGWAVGFALGYGWQGIDLDDLGTNGLSELANALSGYVETSPSGKGVHAIGFGRQFQTLGSNGSGVEAYSKGRFFTFTGKIICDGELVCLADHVENVLAPRHKATAPRALQAAKVPVILQVSAQTVADLRSALNHMRSDDYALWIEVGHALKPLGDTGRGLWMDWSTTSLKFDPQEAGRKWDSFDPQHTGYQVVFARAQARGWINPASNGVIFAKFAGEAVPAERPSIGAVPFIAPDLFEIPHRLWVFGWWLLRGTVTTVIAPGGTGKSALMVAMALSLATGQNFLGKPVKARSQRAWLWNLEDDRDELTRQIFACAMHHQISGQDYEGRLFVNDATSPLCVATKGRDGLTIHDAVIAAVIAEIRARGIDVLIVDPFVSSHRAEENDNSQIDAIAKLWAMIARETGCSIVLVHHSRKLAGQQVDAEAARGASALGNAARSVLVLNRMDKSEAARFGIREEDRRGYIRVSNDKSNRAPAGEADWFRLISIRLAYGGPDGGDSIGVIERWMPPDATVAAQNFDDAARAKVQMTIAGGEWRGHPSAKNWAGQAIASIIGAETISPADRHRVKALLCDMLLKGELRTETRLDASRHQREFIVVGNPIGPDCDSPA